MAATKEARLRTLITHIRAGQYDGQLQEINQAIREHIASTDDIAIKWKVAIDGVEVTEDDLTFPEACDWEQRAGVSWLLLSPAGSAKVCRALLVTVLTSRKGMTEEEANDHLNSWTHAQVVGSISEYEVDLTPLEHRQT